MKLKSSLRKNTRFSDKKIKQIIEYFCDDVTASYASKKLGIWRKTINNWYKYFRTVIYWFCMNEKEEKVWGIFEVDESYFWPTRIKWKRGRWAWWKTIVFWLLKRDGKVYTEIIPDAKSKSIIPIIRGKVGAWSIINSDGWCAYDGLVDLGYEKHYRVHHGKNEFARGKQHINGIESFWSFTKRRFRKFNGIKREYLPYFLKESEFRYNCRMKDENMEKKMIQILRKYTKQLP